jgi:hypothetical protein
LSGRSHGLPFERKRALLLSYNQLHIRLWAVSRGYGNPDGLLSKDPAEQLLKVLKAGELEAIDGNGNKLPAEFWDERSSNPRTWPRVRFRRGQILGLWPGLELPDEVTEDTHDSEIQESVGTSGEGTTPPTKPKRKIRSPKQEIVTAILPKVFANGVPGRNEVPDEQLVHLVTQSLPGRIVISRDTILRAAGRRVDKA